MSEEVKVKDNIPMKNKGNKPNKKSEAAKNDKKIIIIAAAIFAVVVIACALFIPTSPFNIFNLFKDNSANEQIENLKEIYSEQGIELDDREIDVTTTTNEDGEQVTTVSVNNADKKNQLKEKTQINLNNIYGPATGLFIGTIGSGDPNQGQNGNSGDGNDDLSNPSGDSGSNPDVNLPTVDDVVEAINKENERAREFFEKSFEEDKFYTDDYTTLLLKQRRTGDPSSSAEFPCTLTVNGGTTYADVQIRLNGQLFEYITYPERVLSEEQTHFYPYYNTRSDKLLVNYITKGFYNKTLTADDMSVEAYNEGTYVLDTSRASTTYKPLLKLKTADGNIIMGMANNRLMMLDVE